jgi:hypothetical protein
LMSWSASTRVGTRTARRQRSRTTKRWRKRGWPCRFCRSFGFCLRCKQRPTHEPAEDPPIARNHNSVLVTS